MKTSFQFVSITKPGYGWKNQNEHIVRSHVMRQIRRKQRVKREAEQSDLENGPEPAKKVDAGYGFLGSLLDKLLHEHTSYYWIALSILCLGIRKA
jgi:hypothetical protein